MPRGSWSVAGKTGAVAQDEPRRAPFTCCCVPVTYHEPDCLVGAEITRALQAAALPTSHRLTTTCHSSQPAFIAFYLCLLDGRIDGLWRREKLPG